MSRSKMISPFPATSCSCGTAATSAHALSFDTQPRFSPNFDVFPPRSAIASGDCFITTANLDGESALKVRLHFYHLWAFANVHLYIYTVPFSQRGGAIKFSPSSSLTLSTSLSPPLASGSALSQSHQSHVGRRVGRNGDRGRVQRPRAQSLPL